MTRQLGHGRHEGTGTHVTLELLWDWLLWGGVELLLERDWLEGSEPASNIVDDGDGLRLRRRQTCERGCSLNVPSYGWVLKTWRDQRARVYR